MDSRKTSTFYVGYSIVRKTDTRLSKGTDVVVCLPGARIEHVTERVEKIKRRGNGGSILLHVGTNNADKEGTTAIVEKYRHLLKKTKQARVGQIILLGMLPLFGNRIQGYRNSKRMAVNGMVEPLCKEACHELPGEANRTSKRKRGDMRNKDYMEAIKEQTQNGK